MKQECQLNKLTKLTIYLGCLLQESEDIQLSRSKVTVDEEWFRQNYLLGYPQETNPYEDYGEWLSGNQCYGYLLLFLSFPADKKFFFLIKLPKEDEEKKLLKIKVFQCMYWS